MIVLKGPNGPISEPIIVEPISELSPQKVGDCDHDVLIHQTADHDRKKKLHQRVLSENLMNINFDKCPKVLIPNVGADSVLVKKGCPPGHHVSFHKSSRVRTVK